MCCIGKMVLKLFLIYYVIGQINKCVDALRARVFTLEGKEELIQVFNGRKQIKKKTTPWKWIGIGDISVQS